ncbi:hypothetical protein BJX66DRAFT_336885 [Aspergillus keveii]|uniref:Uncharacterized protein n=1 Tax=Aspergillus keveii TaxID=714993 RepID=A0ABR4G941_9EURO
MPTTQGTLEIHIARTNYRDQPEHWVRVLMLRAPDAARCTFVHSTAESMACREYKRAIDHDQHFKHDSFPYRDKLASIKVEDQRQVLAAAQAVEPQHCQRYVIAVLEKLEGKGLVPRGTGTGISGKLVVEQGGKNEAVKYLLKVQGWVDPQGRVGWNTRK